MNEAHLHRIINHFTIIGLIIGLLTLVAGYIAKNKTVKTTDVSHQLIHEHEERAETLYLMNSILGLLSIATLWFQAKKAALVKYAYIIIAILAVGASVAATLTGTTGGEIRHIETMEFSLFN